MILSFIALASIMTVLSVLLSNLIDRLDKKSHLSSALIGGVLLAAATSLPELFTSMTAVISLGNANMVLGNVLGSNFFNLLIMALVIIFFAKSLKTIVIEEDHKITAWFSFAIFTLIIMTLLSGIDITILGISVFSIVILVLYFLAIKKMAASKKEETEATRSLNLKPYIIGFILLSALILVTSIFLTITTERLAIRYNIGFTVAGALFLGVVTSLPELVASINLARLKNFNAAFGNVLGSNLFNFLILVLSDTVYRVGSLYVPLPENKMLVLFGGLASILAIIALYKTKWARLVGLLLILSYCLYLILAI
ncbi:MAG: sodium:calcium antiporter [Candidatus Izemoplasmataceae bacterium]